MYTFISPPLGSKLSVLTRSPQFHLRTPAFPTEASKYRTVYSSQVCHRGANVLSQLPAPRTAHPAQRLWPTSISGIYTIRLTYLSLRIAQTHPPAIQRLLVPSWTLGYCLGRSGSALGLFFIPWHLPSGLQYFSLSTLPHHRISISRAFQTTSALLQLSATLPPCPWYWPGLCRYFYLCVYCFTSIRAQLCIELVFDAMAQLHH